MAVAWTITNPSGSGTSALDALGISRPVINFRIVGASTASLEVQRDFDSGDAWWAADSVVTIYRDAAPYYTGRVKESPISADASNESRTLYLTDAWDDLETTIYQESWPIGSGSVLYPRCILGLDDAGAQITTGEQIAAVIDYAIATDVDITKGTIDSGLQLWPSEVVNTSCESVIVEEMRFHPNWAAWLDHSTAPPTFNARPQSALAEHTLNIDSETVESFSFAPVVRNVPLGVRIIYNSAVTIDGEVYRNGYLDTAGVVTGRRVMQAMLDLQGMTMQYQKSRVQTRTLPTENAEMTAYFKKKWPELQDMPDGAFQFTNFAAILADEETHPDPICAKATRLSVADASDLPRELISGSIEDWMRVKVGRVAITYDLEIVGTPSDAQRKILDNFSGTGKSFSVTATNATTKIYKGISSFDEGESVPTGIAAAVFAAATADQYEGSVTVVAEDVPAGTWHGSNLILAHGVTEIMPGAIVYSASMDIERGSMTLSFGPLPYLSAGDFLELQRMFQRRKVCWMSDGERTSNTLGAESAPGSKGDTVGGYDQPITVTPPGGASGGGTSFVPWKLTTSLDGSDIQWAVSSASSGITDGTNGDAIDLSSAGFDTPTTITAEKYIVLEADVDTDLVVSGWALAAVDSGACDEVGMTTSETIRQNKLRLVIGKVTIGDGVGTAWQACFTSQRITHGILDGIVCKVFESAPTHPTKI